MNPSCRIQSPQTYAIFGEGPADAATHGVNLRWSYFVTRKFHAARTDEFVIG